MPLLTPDQIGAGAVGIVIIIGALGKYFRSLRSGPKTDPVLAGIGGELGSREQMERLIGIHTRIAVALEVLADKRTDEIADMHKTLLARMDAQERRNAPRRR